MKTLHPLSSNFEFIGHSFDGNGTRLLVVNYFPASDRYLVQSPSEYRYAMYGSTVRMSILRQPVMDGPMCENTILSEPTNRGVMKTKLSQIVLPEGFTLTHLSPGSMVAQKDSRTVRAWHWEGERLIERHLSQTAGNLSTDLDCHIDATVAALAAIGAEIVFDF